jgi:WD40 repeat protein
MDWFTSVTLADDGQTLVAGTGQFYPAGSQARRPGQVYVGQKHGDRVELRLLPGQAAHWLCVALSPDSRFFACGGYRWDGTSSRGLVTFWDLAKNSSRTLASQGRPVFSVAFSPKRSTLATGGWEDGVKLWDLDTGESKNLAEPPFTSISLRFSPDERFLASGGGGWDDGRIKVWEGDGKGNWQLVTTLEHERLVTSVAFSTDGETLAAADWSGAIKLWEIPSGRQPVSAAGHRVPVLAVVLSPDGRTLASGGLERNVRLWRAGTGNLLASLPTQTGVNSLTFSADGKTLVAGGMDRSVQLWRVGAEDITIHFE